MALRATAVVVPAAEHQDAVPLVVSPAGDAAIFTSEPST